MFSLQKSYLFIYFIYLFIYLFIFCGGVWFRLLKTNMFPDTIACGINFVLSYQSQKDHYDMGFVGGDKGPLFAKE